MNRLSAAFLLLLLAAAGAQASQQGLIVEQRWKAMDKCAKLAQTEFPDLTPDANTKRDAKLKECLAGQNLPPRDPSAPGR